MYKRTSGTGHEVVWIPEDENAAIEAMENTPGIPDDVVLPDEANVQLDNETVQSVVEEYENILGVSE